ncbi:protein of unknown function [Serratia sp. Tan611]|nr:protein of unknown function [Serratia sp. Tan611]
MWLLLTHKGLVTAGKNKSYKSQSRPFYTQKSVRHTSLGKQRNSPFTRITLRRSFHNGAHSTRIAR